MSEALTIRGVVSACSLIRTDVARRRSMAKSPHTMMSDEVRADELRHADEIEAVARAIESSVSIRLGTPT